MAPLVRRFGEAVVLVRNPGGLGTGFLVSREGHLVTNYHVVEKHTQLQVTMFRKVAAGAKVFLADEPTSALDFDTRDAVAKLLTRVPVTSIVVTHDAAVTDGADRVLEMAAGRVREVAR